MDQKFIHDNTEVNSMSTKVVEVKTLLAGYKYIYRYLSLI